MTEIVLQRRSLPGQLRYLARKLTEDASPVSVLAVRLALEVIAGSLDSGDGPRFTCPRCGMTSYNDNDIREGYCGNCHDWTR